MNIINNVKNKLVLRVLALCVASTGFILINSFSSTINTQTYAVITENEAKEISKRICFNIDNFCNRAEFFYGNGNFELEERICADIKKLIEEYFKENLVHAKSLVNSFWEELSKSIWSTRFLSNKIKESLEDLKKVMESCCGQHLSLLWDVEKKLCIDACDRIEEMLELFLEDDINWEKEAVFINCIDCLIKYCSQNKEGTKWFAENCWERLDLTIGDSETESFLPIRVRKSLEELKKTVEGCCGVKVGYFSWYEKMAAKDILLNVSYFVDGSMDDKELENVVDEDIKTLTECCLKHKEKAKRFISKFWKEVAGASCGKQLPGEVQKKLDIFKELAEKYCGIGEFPPLTELVDCDENGEDIENNEPNGSNENDENNENNENNENQNNARNFSIYGLTFRRYYRKLH